jgi:hypothetical protein
VWPPILAALTNRRAIACLVVLLAMAPAIRYGVYRVELVLRPATALTATVALVVAYQLPGAYDNTFAAGAWILPSSMARGRRDGAARPRLALAQRRRGLPGRRMSARPLGARAAGHPDR